MTPPDMLLTLMVKVTGMPCCAVEPTEIPKSLWSALSEKAILSNLPVFVQWGGSKEYVESLRQENGPAKKQTNKQTKQINKKQRLKQTVSNLLLATEHVIFDSESRTPKLSCETLNPPGSTRDGDIVRFPWRTQIKGCSRSEYIANLVYCVKRTLHH